MRGRIPLFVLLASSLTFIASLFLRWIESGIGTTGVLSILDESLTYDGWGPNGQVAALVALALAAGAGASLVRPELHRRLPFATAGIALLYLALLNAAHLHGFAIFAGAYEHVPIRLGPGAYLGLACAGVALLAALGARWDELVRRPSVTTIVAFGLTGGLLAAYILPWLTVHVPRVGPGATGYQLVEVGNVVVSFIALLACFGLPLWGARTPPARRLVTAVGLAVLVGGALNSLGGANWPYEAWLQLGCSLGLVAVALATGRGLRISQLPVADLAAAAAASLLIFSMFLPWEKVCGPGHGACVTHSGWTETDSAAAGGLAVILLVLLLGFRHLFVELAVGAVIYVMAAGFLTTQPHEPGDLGYGAPFGFAGAALLLVATARRVTSAPTDRTRLLARFVPMGACLCFLALPVVTMTGRLSFSLEFDSPWRVYWLWFELAAVLLAVRLLGRWLGGPKADDELVLLPPALLVLTVLDVILARRAFASITWEGWLSIGLCVLLAVLGWLERTSGLEKLRIPEEIWRVDRLPDVEG
jgi:hypothetical protein